MTPLTTLRIAQLFQISWPRISSTVGNLMGSIGGLSASFGLEGPFVDSFPVSEAMDVARIRSGNWHNSKNACVFVCALEDRSAVVKMMSHGGFVASPPVKYRSGKERKEAPRKKGEKRERKKNC